MSDSLTVDTPDGSFQAYVARPATVPAASIVVIQEIFGVNADLRQTCDELAAQGYIAVSPDLFWRMQPGVDLSDRTEAEWKKGMALYTAFDIEKGVADIEATMKVARGLPRASGKIGLMGYCLGGIKAALQDLPDAHIYSYPGRSHAFARHRGAHYDAAAATLANGRTAEFFELHLRSR